MRFIDERGRLFGKLNLIDAIVVLFVLVLIPLAYGAFLLFRVPVPTITAIEPAQVVEKQPATVRLSGRDLRPFMRAVFGTYLSEGFLVQSTTVAEIKVPPTLPAGTYDLVLYDESQELVRKPGALTVVAPPPSAVPPPPPPPPPVAVQIVGTFLGVSEHDAKQVKVGSVVGPFAEVVAVRPPQRGLQRVLVNTRQGTAVVETPVTDTVQIPAVLRVRCRLAGQVCYFGDVPIAQDAEIVLAAQGGSPGAPAIDAASLRFLVTEVQPANAPPEFPTTSVATVRVRFVVNPELVDLVKAGAVDTGLPSSVRDGRAMLTGIDPGRQTVTALGSFDAAPGRQFQVEQPMVAFTGTLRVPVVQGRSGWEYKGKPVKVGTSFVFETADGFMEGSILGVRVGPVDETAAR